MLKHMNHENVSCALSSPNFHCSSSHFQKFSLIFYDVALVTCCLSEGIIIIHAPTLDNWAAGLLHAPVYAGRVHGCVHGDPPHGGGPQQHHQDPAAVR